jgi:hypothetical protein
MRAIALLVLFAVLPTVELTEQMAHVVAHVLEREPAAHSAHHEDDQHGDEHGCTGLVHLCACHHAQITLGAEVILQRSTVAASEHRIEAPDSLVDLTTQEPAQRPPIG